MPYDQKHCNIPGPGSYNPKFTEDVKLRVKSAKKTLGTAEETKNLSLMKQFRNTLFEQNMRASMDVPGPGHYDPIENDITSFTCKKVPIMGNRNLKASRSSRNFHE